MLVSMTMIMLVAVFMPIMVVIMRMPVRVCVRMYVFLSSHVMLLVQPTGFRGILKTLK